MIGTPPRRTLVVIAITILISSYAPATSSASAFTFSAQGTQRTKHPQTWKHNNNPSPIATFLGDAARSRTHRTQLQLQPAAVIPDGFASSPFLLPLGNLVKTLFPLAGNSVPLLPSFLLNALLFFSLRPKLNTMLTPAGFYHSFALGTLLWTALGWRGWTVCVLYLFLGQLVTKVFDLLIFDLLQLINVRSNC
jgi:hypothetical protein